MGNRHDIAGGESTRMGSDKAMLLLDGVPFIQRIARTLKREFAEVFIVSDHKERYSFAGLPSFEDIFPQCGPLGGIYSALTHAPTTRVFVTACDMPLLSSPVIRFVLRRALRNGVTLLVGGNSHRTSFEETARTRCRRVPGT